MGDMKSKVFYGGLLMKITVSFTVHIYAEERLCDELLIPHSENYGIVGEEIIEPLRIINNKSIMFEVENSVSIKEFYQLIRRHTEQYVCRLHQLKKSGIA